jgi:hypothetical protein
MPRLDGISYEAVSTTDGKLCIAAKGDTGYRFLTGNFAQPAKPIKTTGRRPKQPVYGSCPVRGKRTFDKDLLQTEMERHLGADTVAGIMAAA